MDETPENQLHDLIAAARRAGADAAEASTVRSETTSALVRLGKLETVQREENEAWNLRVWVGARSASVSSIDIGSTAARDALLERTLAMARAAPEDPYRALAPAELVEGSTSDEAEDALDLFDPTEVSAAALEDQAREAEAAALAVDGVTNSDGGSAWASASRRWHITTEGFWGRRQVSGFGVFVSAIAGTEGAMETDGHGRSACWRADLPSAEVIGGEAGRRAVARLGARKLVSRRAPVIFERRIAMQLLSPFIRAISGTSIARGSSFLKDRLGKPVFASGVRILDNPGLARGLGSRVVDAEGVRTAARALVDNGVLTTWLLDVASARQLALTPNGYGGMGPSNLILAPGTASLGELMAQAGEGLLVTGMFGPSLNLETGDWSAGVNGVWFEKGEAAFPVSEITVAGTLPDFYARLVAGSDLEIEGAANAPSLLIDAVAIGGS